MEYTERKLIIAKKLSKESSKWFTGQSNVEILNLKFYKYLDEDNEPSGLIADTHYTPQKLWTSIKNDIYDYTSNLAKKYGALKPTGNVGSYSAIFLYEKRKEVFELLEKNGWIIFISK